MPDTKYEISATRRDEFDEIMAMTRRAAVFNETEVDTVIELLEGYEEGPEISGYNFLSCRIPAHPERNEVQPKDERNEVQPKDGRPGQIIGYACWGPRELSGNGYDLYWICADPAVPGRRPRVDERRRRGNPPAARRVAGHRDLGHRALRARPTVV